MSLHNLEIVVATVTRPLLKAELTPEEALQFEKRFSEPDSPRSAQWLFGRAALREVLRRLGQPENTAFIRFPDPSYSVSHCNDRAIAIGLPPDAQGNICGVGIDLERFRPLPLRAEHYFLQDHEVSALDSLDSTERAIARIRLWTAKEALFKADPHNARTRTIKAYRLSDPLEHFSLAENPASHGFAVQMARVDEWFMSIAFAYKS